MIRRLVGLAILSVLAAAGLGALPAAAQTDNYQGCGAVLSDVTVDPGQTINVSGDGAAPGATVTATLDGTTVIGNGTADSSGVYSFSATIPANTSGGSHTIGVNCGPGGGVQGITIEVSAARAGGGGAVATTGSDSTIPLTKLAIALIVVGGVTVAFARRRRTSQASPA